MTLGVNALTAREMLTRFHSAHRSKSGTTDTAPGASDAASGTADAASGLTATFCVAGESADPATGNAQIILRLVKESRVDEVKKTLNKVIGVYVYR